MSDLEYCRIDIPHHRVFCQMENIEHAALDRLHHAMELMFGASFWGAARDIVAAVNRRNGDTPPFHVAMTSSLEIFLTANSCVSAPAAVLLLSAAWTWLDATNGIHHVRS